VKGGADRSYGIQVARLAGLPPGVLQRAKEILQGLEERETDSAGKPARIKPKGVSLKSKPQKDQMDLFSARPKSF